MMLARAGAWSESRPRAVRHMKPVCYTWLRDAEFPKAIIGSLDNTL